MNELIMGAIIVGAAMGAIALVALLALRWFQGVRRPQYLKSLRRSLSDWRRRRDIQSRTPKPSANPKIRVNAISNIGTGYSGY
jgi:hypothetical protein